MFGGPKIIKGDGALGAKAPSEDNIMGLVASAPLPLTGTYDEHGKVVLLIQASDADALGIDAAYDANSSVLVRYHIDEFFRLCPTGKLYLMLSELGTTMEDMCDKNEDYVAKLIRESANKVKSIGVVLNVDNGYTPDTNDGIDSDVLSAAAKAQELVNDFATRNIFVDMVVLEGKYLSETSGDWSSARELEAPNVHVAVLQDKDIADLDSLYEGYAAVGTVLGGIAIRRVEEDLGAVVIKDNPIPGSPNARIDSAAQEKWLRPAISSGVLCKDLTPNEIALLVEYGYVFADSYPEYSGVFFSGSPAATVATSDFAFGVNTRVWNKAARIAVKKLTPKMNSNVEVIDGKIQAATILGWEADVNNGRDGLATMVADEHCLKTKAVINPDQDVMATSKVVVKMAVTPYSYARTIEGELSFSRS